MRFDTQNAYGGHTYAQAYNPWTGTYAATSQGHNQYSQWGSSVVTNGDNWAQAQHVTNSQGTAGSFQTSKGSAGAGVSGANGNSGFVAKDANNKNVYAGADGNVYKKDSNGNRSKYDNGNWTPVDPSTGAAQAKQQKQNSTSPNSLTQSQSKGSSNLGAQSATPPSAGSGFGSTTPRAFGQSSQAQPSTQAPSSGNNTMGQLQNDSQSRDRGDQLEQFQNRGGGAGAGAARGSRRQR